MRVSSVRSWLLIYTVLFLVLVCVRAAPGPDPMDVSMPLLSDEDEGTDDGLVVKPKSCFGGIFGCFRGGDMDEERDGLSLKEHVQNLNYARQEQLVDLMRTDISPKDLEKLVRRHRIKSVPMKEAGALLAAYGLARGFSMTFKYDTARLYELYQKSHEKGSVGGRSVYMVGFNPVQRRMVLTDVRRAMEMAKFALGNLNSFTFKHQLASPGGIFKKYFRPQDAHRVRRVLEKTYRFKHVLIAPWELGEETIASVFYNGFGGFMALNTRLGYFLLDDVERASIMLHELTHWAAHTKDVSYRDKTRVKRVAYHERAEELNRLDQKRGVWGKISKGPWRHAYDNAESLALFAAEVYTSMKQKSK